MISSITLTERGWLTTDITHAFPRPRMVSHRLPSPDGSRLPLTRSANDPDKLGGATTIVAYRDHIAELTCLLRRDAAEDVDEAVCCGTCSATPT